jgi:hypothetical protein
MKDEELEDLKQIVLDAAEYAFNAAENGENLEDVKQNILE